MSVGGGFKKGKAEFAMKDIDGNDIKTATESFRYEVSADYEGVADKVLSVNGIDIKSLQTMYGVYFRYNQSGTEYEYNIYADDEALWFIGDCKFNEEVYFGDGVHLSGPIYDNTQKHVASEVTSFGKPAYLSCNDAGQISWSGVNDIHCWQFKKDNITLFIYLADYTGNSATENIFTYFNGPVSEDEFNLRVNKIVNIRGIHPNQYSKEFMGAYDITRGPGSSGESVNFAVTFISRDSTGAMNVATRNCEMTSASYQNGEIKLIF